MPKYLYLDSNGQKCGPINDEQLKELAARGIITPETPLATDAGHKGKASQIPGLQFGSAAPSPFVQTAQPASQNVSEPVAEHRKGSSWLVTVIGIALVLIVGGVGWSLMSNQTPRFTAAEQLEIDRFLGKYGNDWKTSETILHDASRNETLTIVKYLVSQGLSVHARMIGDRTPLHLAMYNKDTEIAKFLISQGADVNAKGYFGKTPLHKAVENGNVEVVKLLLSNGADVNLSNPLYNAVWNGNVEVIKLLLSNGADVNVKTGRFGETLLKTAVGRGDNVEVIKLLLSKARAASAYPLRAANWQFSEIGIEPGEELLFDPDPAKRCKVIDDKQGVEYEGKIFSSLVNLAREIFPAV